MSQCLSPKIRTAIRRGAPVFSCGVALYPILMKDYEEFLQLRNSICLRMRTLPVKYMMRNYLSALFSLEIDTIKESGHGVGLFQSFLRFLQLSLRIEAENAKETFEKMVRYKVNGKEIELDCIVVDQEGQKVRLNPKDISMQIRPILAYMNGVELPDENENPELVLANEQKRAFDQRKQKPLNTDVNDLIASVAYLSHCSERDLLTWTVREFEARRRAIDRDKRYTLYGQAEMSGMITFKEGNPAPSWCYDAIDESFGTTALSKLDFGGATEKQ